MNMSSVQISMQTILTLRWWTCECTGIDLRLTTDRATISGNQNFSIHPMSLTLRETGVQSQNDLDLYN